MKTQNLFPFNAIPMFIVALAMAMVVFFTAGCSEKKKDASASTSPTTPLPSANNSVPNLADLKSADGHGARILQGPDFDNLLVSAKEFQNLGRGDYVVTGNKLFDGWFLKADRIIFEPGATLTFSKTALSNRRQFWVVAKELVAKDANNPGTINWEKGAVALAPASPGEAPGGASATIDDRSGAAGQTGGVGIGGNSGANAPQITLVVMKVPNSGVLIDLTGGDGGSGGQGQKGGRGGNGAKGHPASESMFDCKRGGGDGGRGGPGGQGGTGGLGGVGGTGGTFLLVSSADLLPSLTQKFRIKVSGGNGGGPGPGGIGGDFGVGGPGGQEAKPYCGGGSDGQNGVQGSTGGLGDSGHSGQEGDFTVGSATDDQFKNYIWGTNK